MFNNIFWDLFEKSGNIDAYLAYRDENYFLNYYNELDGQSDNAFTSNHIQGESGHEIE